MTRVELQAELLRLARVTQQQESTIDTLVSTVSQLRDRLEQMEEEWMEWATSSSRPQLTVAPPGLMGPEHFQLSDGVVSPALAGAGFTDPTDEWYVTQQPPDLGGHRDQPAAQMSWPNARQDTSLAMMPQPQGAPFPRLPGEESTLGGVELPRREVNLTLDHGHEGVLALSRDSESTRRPEVSGRPARSIFGPGLQQRSESMSIADAQGINSIDAGTTRNGTLASRLNANSHLTEVQGLSGGHPPTFSATRDSQLFSFLAMAQQGRSIADQSVSPAGAPIAAGLDAQTFQSVFPSQVPGCVPPPPGASGGCAEARNTGAALTFQRKLSPHLS